jgi:hypothetical protein
MTLVDSDGVEVLGVEPNGDCVTKVIEEGGCYEMRIHHDGRTEEMLPVFINVPYDDGVGAKNAEADQGILKASKRLSSETFRIFGINQEGRAPSVAEDIEEILQTKTLDCSSCD